MRAFALVVMLLLVPVSTGFAQAPAAQAPTADASVDELIRIIENDDTRAALLDRLRQSAAATAAPAEAASDTSIARQLAEYTRHLANNVAGSIQALGQAFRDLSQSFSGNGVNFDSLRAAGAGVFIVGAALIGSLLVLRAAARWLQGRIAMRVAGRRWSMRGAGMLGAVALDIGAIILAWAIGNVVGLNWGAKGSLGIDQTLLLNSFLLVEMGRMVLRAVLRPRFGALRLLPVSDGNAHYWASWLTRIAALLGYTFLFVSPMIAGNFNVGIAEAVLVLAMVVAMAIGIAIIVQCRQGVRLWLENMAGKRSTDGFGQALRLLAGVWHIIAIGYVVALLVMWLLDPEQGLPFILWASVQTCIAVLVGMLAVRFVSQFVNVGLHVPEAKRRRLPLLEARLHALVPKVMRVVRLVVIAGVVLAIAQSWTLFDFTGWISSDRGQQVAVSAILAALIVLACFVLHVAMESWVAFRLKDDGVVLTTSREKTLLSLFKNAFTIALVVFGLMLTLAQLGVNIAPLLAGAGVLGLAIGFGAQKFVQDIITGIFIQFENVMNEGDVVEVAGKSGVVEKLTIRSVTIRDLGGTVHLIPFSSVDLVSNMVRGFSYHVAIIGVAYDSDIDAVKVAMGEAFDRLMQTAYESDIIDALEMHGVTGFADSAIMVRARIKTLPGKHWGVGRAYNEFVKLVFQEHGIEMPFPHITYVRGGEARASGRVLRHHESDKDAPAT